MTSGREFHPEWASPPGDTIADILRERSLSEVEFAKSIDQTPKQVIDLLKGNATITIEIARRLGKVLGSSVEFWMSRDFQYRQGIARLHQSDQEWLRALPIGDMIKFGWLNSVPHPTEEVAACLQFFDVPSVRAWREAYSGLQQTAAFRTSPSFESRLESVAVWLRRGEIEAERIECGPWNVERFREALYDIRSLSRRSDPSTYIPVLKDHCSNAGVAVVIVRTPNGCRASGAVRFLSPSKVLMQLSLRHLTDDHFWFTFFHEAGHLILHGEKNCFSDVIRGEKSWILDTEDTVSTSEEYEANNFAADILIPSELQKGLLGLGASSVEVIRFAVRAGISPGIVVGQLQHLGRIRHDQLNSLKRRFTWEN